MSAHLHFNISAISSDLNVSAATFTLNNLKFTNYFLGDVVAGQWSDYT